MSQRWIPIRTNSDSDFVITEVRKLNEVELSKKEKKRKLIEENRQKRIDKKLKEQEKVSKNLDNLDTYYKKVSYLKKRIGLQTEYFLSLCKLSLASSKSVNMVLPLTSVVAAVLPGFSFTKDSMCLAIV